jgi:tetratricopeptide (TPR) repeat protein
MAYYQRHRGGNLSVREASPAAHAAIDRAMKLAPHDFMSQFQLATVHLHLDLDYARAEAELRALLKRQPKFGLIHLRLARIALREGRTSEALGLLVNASQLEAGNEKANYLGNLAWLLCVAGDYEGALEATTVGLTLALGSQDRKQIIGTHAASLIQLGRTEEARPFVDQGWKLDRGASPENYIALFANIGEIEKSKNISKNLRFGLVNYYALATGYLALKDIDHTFKSIHAGIENNDQNLLESILVAEWWNPIRDDPRFSEMLDSLDSKVTHTQTYLKNFDPMGR